MKKICGKCQVEKTLDNFHRRGNGYKTWCKSCTKEYDQEYQKENNERRKPIRKAYKDEFLKWYWSLKEDIPCSDCKNIFHPVAMQWDHRPDTFKENNVSDLINIGNRTKLLKEIEKCDLVCANCHALRTWNRLDKGVPGTPPVSDTGNLVSSNLTAQMPQ